MSCGVSKWAVSRARRQCKPERAERGKQRRAEHIGMIPRLMNRLSASLPIRGEICCLQQRLGVIGQGRVGASQFHDVYLGSSSLRPVVRPLGSLTGLRPLSWVTSARAASGVEVEDALTSAGGREVQWSSIAIGPPNESARGSSTCEQDLALARWSRREPGREASELPRASVAVRSWTA
jgi:hypothetical protein